MYTMLNIPDHNCQNCGECCGPVPASKKEIEHIRQYLKENPHALSKMGKGENLTCVFRNEEEKKCLIYPVRPLVCRLMGVAKGLICTHGNSANIDGRKFLDETFAEEPQLLNAVRWGEFKCYSK